MAERLTMEQLLALLREAKGSPNDGGIDRVGLREDVSVAKTLVPREHVGITDDVAVISKEEEG